MDGELNRRMEARESRKEGKDKVYLLLNIEAGGSEVEIFRMVFSSGRDKTNRPIEISREREEG